MIHPEIRLINKVLQVGNLTETEKLKVSEDFFRLAECKEAFKYIKDYSKNLNTLGYIPTFPAFKKRFPNFTLFDEVPDPIPVLCQELRQDYMERQLEEILSNGDILRRTDPYEALNYIQSNVSLMMSQHTGNNLLFNIKDSGQLLTDKYKLAKENEGILGIRWPYESLNIQTGGIKKKDWIVKYGRPASGKTTTTIGEVAYIFRKTNLRCGIFNFEDDEMELLNLFACFLCNVDYNLCKRGQLNPADEKLYMATLSELTKYDGQNSGKCFFVEQCKGSDLNHIKSRIEEFSLDVAVINGVYFVKDGGAKKTDMDWKVMTNLSRNCKQVARETDAAIIGITQAHRGAEQVAYSDAFTQDADVIIKIEPHIFEDSVRGAKILLEKVRAGGEPVSFYINSRPGLEISERTGIQVVNEQKTQGKNFFSPSGTKMPMFTNGKR